MLASSKQRQFCLGAGHSECATFRAAQALLGAPSQGAFEADLWPRTSPRLVTFEPVRAGFSGGITTPRARAGGQLLLVAMIVVAFAVLVLARTTSPTGSTTGDASPVPTVAAGAGVSASPDVAATPAASPAATPPLASAAPGPSASAVPSGPTANTYKVKRGDTLSSIARKFGVTLKALRKANGLAKDAVIRRGQVLVIPEAAPTPAP